MFCSSCGKEIDDKAVVCIHCGCPTKNYETKAKKDKNIALLLAFFLGGFGLHRFYMDEPGIGAAILIVNIVCTCMFLLVVPLIITTIIWIVELILMMLRPAEDFR